MAPHLHHWPLVTLTVTTTEEQHREGKRNTFQYLGKIPFGTLATMDDIHLTICLNNHRKCPCIDSGDGYWSCWLWHNGDNGHSNNLARAMSELMSYVLQKSESRVERESIRAHYSRARDNIETAWGRSLRVGTFPLGERYQRKEMDRRRPAGEIKWVKYSIDGVEWKVVCP